MLAEMPWWLVMIVVFSMMGWISRMGHREGGRRKTLRDKEVERLESALTERDQVIEDLQRRVGEMEERLDFTERLLTERSQPAVGHRE